MQECVEFQVAVETPAEDGSAFPAHQHFSELNQLHLFTVPLRCEDQIVGALLLQRRGRGLSEAEKKQVHKIGHFLGALLEARRRSERPLRGWFEEAVPAWYDRFLGKDAGYARYLVGAGLALVVPIVTVVLIRPSQSPGLGDPE